MDKINPSHYKKGEFEVIDIIKASMTEEAFWGYLEGNIIKYTLRYKEKNGVEDLKKMQWYTDRLIKEKYENS